MNEVTGKQKLKIKISLDVNGNIEYESKWVQYLGRYNKIAIGFQCPSRFIWLRILKNIIHTMSMQSVMLQPAIAKGVTIVNNSLKNNISPGIDQLSPSLIKTIASRITKTILVYLTNYSF